MHRRRFRPALLVTLAMLALCAGLGLGRVEATEEPADDADDGTITTMLLPGWNMVGWVGADVPATEIFDQVQNLERVSAWDGEHQRYQRRTRNSISRFGLERLEPGRGLMLFIGGDDPVAWTRAVSEQSVLLHLHAGRNLVGWAGRDGTPIEDAVQRFGATLVEASLWDASTNQYLRYRPDPESANTLIELDHGDALWVELSAAASWWQSGAAPPPVELVGEFTDDEQIQIQEWVDDSQAVFAERWGVHAPFTAYFGDPKLLDETYRRIRGFSPPIDYCGLYADSLIFIKRTCGGEGTQAHEYFHALQFHLMGSPRKPIPGWLIEGSATFAAYAYLGAVSPSQTVEERIATVRESHESYVGRVDWPTLEESQRPRRTDPHPIGVYYTLGSLGVTWLWEHAGDYTVVDFFRRMASAQNWRDAFEGAFGLTIDDFHEQFEAYRAEAAPLLPHLTDDRAEAILVFTGEVPAEGEQAVREELDSLEAFFGDHLSAAEADFTVFAGAEEATVAAAYRRAFGAALPDEFCARQTSGSVAVLDLNCGESPADVLFTVRHDSVIQQLAPWTSMPRASTGFRTRGPNWLVTPLRTYASYAYQAAAGREGADGIRNQQLARAAQTTRSLKSMATSDGYNENSSESLAVGFLALELLAELAGDAALFEYYRRLPGSSRWEEAFRDAFGMGVSEFYREFKAYRTAAIPPLPHLADQRAEPLLVLVGDVPLDASTAIRNELERLQAFFDRRLRAGAADYTVFAGVDEASVAAAHQQAFGEAPAEDFCSRYTSGRVAVLDLDCEKQDLANTLFRVRFDDAIERLAPTNSLPRPLSGLNRRGPYWLASPTSRYLEYAYQLEVGRDEAQDAWNLHLTRTTYNTRSLSSMETYEGFRANYWQSMGVGFLALDLLARRAGDAALFEYYRRLPGARSWEDAFEGAFGMTVDDFYEAFETHVARIAPPFPHIADGRIAPVLVFVGDVPAETRSAVRAEFDAVQRLFRGRLGAGTADYTLYVGADWAVLMDTYVRALGIQPPERLCDRTPTGGVAIINLGCRHTAPYTLEWSHYIALRQQLAPSGSLPAAPAGFDRRGPYWLRYGAERYVRHVYSVAQGHEDLDTSRHRESARASHTTRLLSGTETSAGFNVNHSQSRALGFLAVELLAELAGEAALFDYYRRLPGSESWEEAFEGAFRIAIDDFYEAFEEHRTRVTSPFPHLTDDSDEPVLMFIGDVPATTRNAVNDEFANLQRFYTEQLAAGTADYTMLVATDSASARVAWRLVHGSEHDRYCNTTFYQMAGVINLGCNATLRAYALPNPHFIQVRDELAPWSSLPLDPDGRRTRGPAWLDGAVAPYIEFRYVDIADQGAYQSLRSTEVQRAKGISRPLSSMATRDGFSGSEFWEARGVAILAVEWLAGRAGDPAIFDYYRRLPDSASWEEAFEGAFGLSVDDFYEAFEEHRARVAPPLPHLTDEIDAPVLLFVGDLPAATRTAVREDFEGALAFFRDRLGEASGDYTLYIGADAASLRDVYRQIDGRESTHSAYCSVPRGPVILISLQCTPDFAWRHSLYVLSGLAVPGVTPAGYPSQGPAWLTEGTHPYVSEAYRAARDSGELDRARSTMARHAAQTRLPLSSMATTDGFRSETRAVGRALGFLAVDWLVERAGERALFDYYRRLADSPSWEDAFEAAFGIAVDDFYEQFEAYRARVAPPN